MQFEELWSDMLDEATDFSQGKSYLEKDLPEEHPADGGIVGADRRRSRRYALGYLLVQPERRYQHSRSGERHFK